MMKSTVALTICAAFAPFATVTAGDYQVHSFEKKHLTPDFWAEGAYFGDFNKDGKNDIVYGPFWFQGPDFTKRHQYTEDQKGAGQEAKPNGFDPNGYSRNFLAYTHDFNTDGWTDILILGFPGEESVWYENPKAAGGNWKRHIALAVTDNESPAFADLTGDGKPEIICNSGGHFGYAEPNWKNPTEPWTWHNITPKGGWQRFTHGMGFGDVNGDGKMDLLEKDAWWEQPASLSGDPEWKRHPASFGGGGAQMFAYDVDGDGDNDVITSLAAHGYGLAWFENQKDGDKITFKQHTFMNATPPENKYGVKFSQLHAVDLVDMDGDGLKDIITGKRYWAHGPKGDAEPEAPAVLYWFKLTRKDKQVDFIPYQIDNDSGVGTQVAAADINGDKLPDVIVGNKKGAFVFLHKTEKVSKEEWEKAQPRALNTASK